MVRLPVLNGIMLELGYHPLVIRAGVANYFRRRGTRFPLPIHVTMSNLPGQDADKVDFYGLDTVVMLLDSLQKYAQERPRSKRVLELIARLRKEVIKDHS